MIFQWLKDWWQNRIVKRSLVSDIEWHNAFQNLSLLHRLNDQERKKLRRLAILFLHYKSLEGMGGLEISTDMQASIALQACLPILNLGLAWYDGWVSLIIYPEAFSKQTIEIDQYGIEHRGRTNLSGESWQRGPVVVSWDDILLRSQYGRSNVLIHELAHKLDMLNGQANGLPPLHKNMAVQQWSEVFMHAYTDFKTRLHQGDPVPVNHYAATSPAEFFAVFSELFFEKPAIIKEHYPEVYELLTQFYRQDPISR